ncbi:MAG TPA: tripartite tricarboxylate transporter substrate binding protein [Xanthobacteraceae bacterium]|nr:tripartite tricarboxylate transporter substrate binding protein [Xanthobacteraceae bacterium]
MTAKLTALIFAVALSVFVSPASAQRYPDRPVKIIVPYTAGGATDAVGRALAQQLSDLWNQPVVVENKAGAGASLGADFVAKSPPDGYTLLFSDSSPFVINPHIYDKLPFDPLKDLEPVALGVELSPALAVSNNAPGTTLADLLDYARTHPDALTYASPGVGNYTHVALEYLKHLAGVKIVHVPYRGTNQVMPDLLSGRVNMFLVTISVFEPYEKEGKLRVIAAATDKRLKHRPDLPTIGETVPGYGIDVWFGMAAPAGTPKAILDKINADVRQVLNEQKFNASFIVPQAYVAGNADRQQFQDMIRTQYEKWRELVKISGAKNP